MGNRRGITMGQTSRYRTNCAGKSRDRSYASCLTAKPPTHHRRVLVWLWRFVAAGRKRRPFGLLAYTPPPLNTSTTNAPKKPLFWGGFRLEAFRPFSHNQSALGNAFPDNP